MARGYTDVTVTAPPGPDTVPRPIARTPNPVRSSGSRATDLWNHRFERRYDLWHDHAVL
jgi:hypothetical protein